ncbi:tetratricopeptide repeat protein [Chitinimonas sp. BJYL2]|uniref:tetratricopeptide repeat protein n=1 Tax=Chitinimonas sp. BJYL2 TaxID=2976696 RepID=UPI0022B5CFF1|nr:tetratricopeptide repeat protein [Chitinimonas sp. BJYL2]
MNRFDLAVTLHQQGELARAIAIYSSLHDDSPYDVSVLHCLGIALLQTGDFRQAIDCLALAAELASSEPEIWASLGAAHIQAGGFECACVVLEKVGELGAHTPASLNNLGNAQSALGLLNEALASYLSAIKLDTSVSEVHCNLGLLYQRLDRSTDALAEIDIALGYQPGNIHALTARAEVLRDLLRPDEALMSLNASLALSPLDPDAHWNRALCLLQMGRLAEGWAEYEWRWSISSGGHKARHRNLPLWLGDYDIRGQTLLVHAEQGFGDTVQFCRYVSSLAEHGISVILQTQDTLVRLLSNLPGLKAVAALSDTPIQADAQCPLMSLPHACRGWANKVSHSQPYIFSDKSSADVWRTKLGVQTRPRIGLVWSGSSKHVNDHRRSMPLSWLMPLMDADCDFHAIQTMISAQDRPLMDSSGISDWSVYLKDFADTSSLVEEMDLVISVDTSVAHLAAAMGKPVWIMLPFNPDWRWQLGRTDTPWYPTMRLFRQSSPGDWAGVCNHVQACLADMLSSYSQPKNC